MRPERRKPPARAISRGVFLALLTALLIGVLGFDRSDWPSVIGDEATYLMAAESLAWDLDLRYERRDYDRFVEHWKLQPEGLILQSGDGGRNITFGKPFFYPLWVAPFARLVPIRGPFVANFVALAVAALVATSTLRRVIGPMAPLWVVTSLFASVVFVYTFWAHADQFLLALTAIALALAFKPPGDSGQRAGSELGRWALVGILLAVVIFSRPLYLPLLLPVGFALPAGRRRRAGAALILGAAGLVAGAAWIHRLHGEAWTSYGAQRRGFYSSTGFPAVDFPAEQWEGSLEALGDAAWVEARALTRVPPTAASLWLWNSIYFAAGRFIGVLPYFLPVVLGLSGRPRGPARWMLLVAVTLSVAGFFLYRPFNIYGGGGAIANRYFLPLFPTFWFMASRPCRPRKIVAIWLIAAPFLWPLWRDAASFPQRSDHTYRYVSEAAHRLLPYETTQSHLKPAGRSDVVHRGLWIKFLSPTLREKRDGSGLLLDRGRSGALLVGVSEPLRYLELQILGDPAERVQVLSGAEVVDEMQEPRGRRWRLELRRPRARHPMWWTWDTVILYELVLQSESKAEGRLTFTLDGLPASGGSRS